MNTPDDETELPRASNSPTTIKIRFIFSSGSPDFSSEYPVETTIKQVREELGSRGSEPTFVLEKDRPRVISGGRIMGDEETLGSLYVDDEREHVLLVATSARKAHSTRPHTASSTFPLHQQSSASGATTSSATSTPNTTTTSSLPPPITMADLMNRTSAAATSIRGFGHNPQLVPNPAYIAVYETLFYYSFLASNDVYTFVGETELKWSELRPAPIHPIERVEQAVKEVLKANGIREDGKKELEADAGEKPIAEWDELVEAREFLKETPFEKNEDGDDTFEVEVNGLPYKVVLPPMMEMTDEQIRALGRYHVHQRMIKTLQDLLVPTPMYRPTPTTTVTITAPPRTTAPTRWIGFRRRRLVLRLRIPIPDFWVVFAIWTQAFWSLIKVGTVLYMFTRGVPRDDPKFVWMGIAAAGWWIWDIVGHVKKHRRARRRAREAEVARVRAARGAAAPAAGGQPRAGRTQAAAAAPTRQTPRDRRWIALDSRLRHYWTNIGLAYDRRVLRLFYFTPDRNAGRRAVAMDVNDRRIPTNDENLPLPPPPPSAMWRYFVLPFVLFFATLVPSLDLGRRAVLLERERHMRLLVEKLTAEKEKVKREEQARRDRQQAEVNNPEQTATAGSDFFTEVAYRASRETRAEPVASGSPSIAVAGDGPAATASVGGATAQPTTSATEAVVPVPMMPRFLSPEAIAYYRRIIGTTERIDWDAEMRAQAELLANDGNQNDPLAEPAAAAVF